MKYKRLLEANLSPIQVKELLDACDGAQGEDQSKEPDNSILQLLMNKGLGIPSDDKPSGIDNYNTEI